MGPQFWKPQASTHLKKCSERTTDSCDPVPTDGCCAVISCRLCLRWVPYSGDEVHGVAEFDTDGWYGTIDGAQFVGYWERNYHTGECEFVVNLDGNEIYRVDCYGGQSCRDSSDSAEGTIDYAAGTLYWTKLEPRPLHYVVDPDTGCRTWFCGTCECSCECLCVTITSPYGSQCLGKICDTSYSDCDAPQWAGTVDCEFGSYDLSLGLGRDSYGDCILTATVNGVEIGSVSVSGCDDLFATIELDDGTIITVQCMLCDCTVTPPFCCFPRCVPLVANTTTGVDDPGDCVNPLPECLTVDLTATPDWGTSNCFNGSGQICYKTPITGGTNEWEGVISGTCVDCNGNTYNWEVTVHLFCAVDGNWTVRVDGGGTCSDLVETFEAFSCDPFRVVGCFTDALIGCFVGCLDDVTLIPGPVFSICFDIYEEPY